jgi:hypothetical protein
MSGKEKKPEAMPTPAAEPKPLFEPVASKPKTYSESSKAKETRG